jgi:hypothetical protein
MEDGKVVIEVGIEVTLPKSSSSTRISTKALIVVVIEIRFRSLAEGDIPANRYANTTDRNAATRTNSRSRIRSCGCSNSGL